MATAISCKATGEFQAEAIVYELKAAEFADDAISVQISESKTILITVHAQTPEQMQRAQEIFLQTEAEDICLCEEAEVRR